MTTKFTIPGDGPRGVLGACVQMIVSILAIFGVLIYGRFVAPVDWGLVWPWFLLFAPAWAFLLYTGEHEHDFHPRITTVLRLTWPIVEFVTRLVSWAMVAIVGWFVAVYAIEWLHTWPDRFWNALIVGVAVGLFHLLRLINRMQAQIDRQREQIYDLSKRTAY